jgi:hypothetical protein
MQQPCDLALLHAPWCRAIGSVLGFASALTAPLREKSSAVAARASLGRVHVPAARRRQLRPRVTFHQHLACLGKEWGRKGDKM